MISTNYVSINGKRESRKTILSQKADKLEFQYLRCTDVEIPSIYFLKDRIIRELPRLKICSRSSVQLVGWFLKGYFFPPKSGWVHREMITVPSAVFNCIFKSRKFIVPITNLDWVLLESY